MMSQRIMINDAIIENNELQLMAADVEIKDMAATGKMLVDSNQMSFIYLIENEAGYQYVSIPEQTWGLVRQALSMCADVFLVCNQTKLKLSEFQSEMDYLIANITGNSNYGEEMVAKVEQIFPPHSV